MFPTFIGILDIQSWWEVPSIAHFCSLFRDAFNLLDFDIEDLEEALLTDGGTDDHLLQELIVKLLEGCLLDDTRNDISTFNYQMFLRRLFRKKCQEYNCENPFNTDVDFELLPLRQKVEILRALCDFRLDTKNVEESLHDLDSDCLRVEPLGHDRKNSAYWYFYGTRLYREDYIKSSYFISQKQKIRPKDRRHKRRRSRLAKKKEEEKAKEENCIAYRNKSKSKESIWQVVCFTLQDWTRLVEKFKDSEYATERKLYRTLSEDFMPEIPKLFDLKEKQQRRRILQRSSVQIIKNHVREKIDESIMVKSKVKTKANKGTKKSVNQELKNSTAVKEVVLPPIQKKGRQTNNSLASAVGQIVIDTRDEVEDVENKKGPGKHGSSISSGYGYGYDFGIEEEERQIGMHKVLKILKDHEEAWPFMDPVDEQYAPRYYSVVRCPMDLNTMEDKLEDGSYKTISQFKRDFRLIIDNCKQYNGSDNEYTEMAMKLKEVFDRAVDRYLETEQSSDDSLSVDSDVGVNFTSCKNKTSSPSFVRHSQRYKHLHKLNKKAKFNTKINKNKTRQRIYDDSAKEESELEINMSKVKEKKNRKIIKKYKIDMKAEASDMKQKIQGAISDTIVIKSKQKKSGIDQILIKNKKTLLKEEIENDSIKVNKKIEKQICQDNEPCSKKELKQNQKRKDNLEEDYDSISIPKNKIRKREKKKNKELYGLTDRISKSKIKKLESQVISIKGEEKLSLPLGKGKKNIKVNKKKSESLGKNNNKNTDKKLKKKNDELLKNGEVKKENDIKNTENIKNINKTVMKKFEALVTNKDIESLDGLKDRISERRREDNLKLEQEKKKNQFLKTDNLHGISKKVPSSGSIYNQNVDKLSNKKFKSKNSNKEANNSENNSQNIEGCESKNIKISYSQHTKGSSRGDPTIQALNQATEQTLNDINKWLDDAPRLSEFSSSGNSPVFHTLINDSSKPTPSKHVIMTATSTTTVVVTGVVTTTTDVLSRKRQSSIKLFGSHTSVRPKKVQRTIDRLQPGKSKGNLLSKKLPLNESNSSNDTAVCQSIADNDQTNREFNNEPKLSLGTVLKNVDSIQLICKSLVSSPNHNLSNDDDDEESGNKSAIPLASNIEEQQLVKKKIIVAASKEAKIEKQIDREEAQKPKSATPNLSAWFKAFGVPKSKKKEEEEEETGSFSASVKKEEILESSNLGGSRQRRVSTGGSSVSESVSSFSQESPPSRTSRSPQQNQQPASVIPSPAVMEPQLRGAGFYHDALSTGSSPYNSPYYTTPPRYSAQLPPTPSPQNQPLSPAYSSSANFDQSSVLVPAPLSLYSQLSPQSSQHSFKSSPHAHSPTFSQQSPQNCFPQNSDGELQQPYTVPTIAVSQNQSPVYLQQTSLYPQPIATDITITQPSTPGYLQPSSQTPVSSYAQPPPSQTSSLNFTQTSPQQQQSPYSQLSPQRQDSSYSQSPPQPLRSYSQPSSQSQQHSPFSLSSPQQPNFSQVSSRPPSSTYSQPSPQPLGYSAQTPNPYSQTDLAMAPPSPQPPPSYAQPSSQTSSPYSAQPSPQQQPPTYSQSSPQTPPSYSQSSPQQPITYSQASPQRVTHQSSVNIVQQQHPQPQITNFAQSSNQQQNQETQHPVPVIFTKNSDDYTQNRSTTSFTQPVKSTYLQSSITVSTPVVKLTVTKEKQLQQQQNAEEHLVTINHQICQSTSNSQYPPTYSGNMFPSSGRASNQLINESSRSTTSRLTNHETQLAQQRQVQQNQEQKTQLLSFQQNLASHESLYSSGFQATSYPMSSVACRPVYSGYFDTSAKSTTVTSSSGNSITPVKKRMYHEPSVTADTSTQRGSSQEQFSFDSLMALAHSQSDVSMAVPNQFDNAFANSLADSVTSNPVYARLQLGLVARTAKDTQQLLSIPRVASKNDSLATYGRTTTPNQSELDLNLLQNLQNATAKGSSMLSMSRRIPEQPSTTAKLKKGRKNKQQLNIGAETQASIQSFSQYSGATSDPIGLKQPSVGGSAFNFAASCSSTNNPAFYDKEASASAAAAAYAFLDDFRNPNLPSYYSMALRQQVQQQHQQQQVQQQQQQTQHQQIQHHTAPTSDSVQQVCNKLSNQTTARNYSGHPFLHSTQRPTPYRPSVPPYVTPHTANLGVDPAAYQQYLHSLYALQPPPHHRPTWL